MARNEAERIKGSKIRTLQKRLPAHPTDSLFHPQYPIRNKGVFIGVKHITKYLQTA